MYRLCRATLFVVTLVAGAGIALALPGRIGDLDRDGRATSADVVRLVNHLSGVSGLPEEEQTFADLDRNGAIDRADLNLLVEFILTGEELPSALATMVTSPLKGEADVALSRETLLEFSAPVQSQNIDDTTFCASFGGEPLSLRAHLSGDRKSVKLFYRGACYSCHGDSQATLPANARIRLEVDGSRLLSDFGTAVDADGDGVEGGSETIDFDTVTLTTVPGTRVCGRIFASKLEPSANGTTSVNLPVEGVIIYVDGNRHLKAETDANGDFCLDPAPAGRFFIFIQGDHAKNPFPSGTFPYIGDAWEGIAGQETNVGTFYLPIIQPDALQPVSMTADTNVHFSSSVLQEFPRYADVRLQVPADSLYSNDGTRGGSVGILPVPPDRLPGEVPSGLDFPVVISIQSDAPRRNFDRPCPICFPNLPDRNGTVLPAGAKSALWSFNHDAGRWEVVGPMTVSADGNLVCTDPGVGVKAPGWHGADPAVSGNGSGAPGGPDPNNDPCNDANKSYNEDLKNCLLGVLSASLEAIGDGLSLGVVGRVGCFANLVQAGLSVASNCDTRVGSYSRSDCKWKGAGGALLNVLGCVPGLGGAFRRCAVCHVSCPELSGDAPEMRRLNRIASGNVCR